MKLTRDTQATQIHPRTGQDLVDCTLPAGTEYKLVLGNPTLDAATDCVQLHSLISVSGFWYRVWNDEL